MAGAGQVPFRVTVVGVMKREGVSQKGQAYAIRRAQVVCQIGTETLVASATIPKDMADLKPGQYDVTIEPYVDREGALQFAITSYVPASMAKAA